MRLEGGEAVGGAGSPGGQGADAAESVIAAEWAPCKELDGERACGATAVAAAGDFVEPLPPSGDMAKTEAKAMSAAGKKYPRTGRRSAVVTVAHTRATNLPE